MKIILTFLISLCGFVKNEELEVKISNECEPDESCVRLCCALNAPDSNCSNLELMPANKNLQQPYKIIKGEPCEDMVFDDEDDLWVFLPNGTISIMNGANETSYFSSDEYCIDGLTELSNEVFYQICTNSEPEPEPAVQSDDNVDKQIIKVVKKLYVYFMLASIPFLVVTLLVYSCIKELRNVHGKCLMSYCFGLILFYLSFGIVQLWGEELKATEWQCETFGYAAYTCILVCFFWLNVMCYDIWLTFRKNSGFKKNENRRFLNYCFYAFGFPVMISIVAFILDHTPNLARDFTIGIINGNCFVHNNKIALIIYLFIPISFVLLFNITFYSITALKIFKVQKEISIVQKRENGLNARVNSHKARFFLYLRLFIIMGVSWIFELLSYVAEESIVLHIVDLLNCLQGVLIFFFFIWKPKIKDFIKNKFGKSSVNENPKIRRQSSSRISTRTLSTQMSTLSCSNS